MWNSISRTPYEVDRFAGMKPFHWISHFLDSRLLIQAYPPTIARVQPEETCPIR
ncbi:hypothetical protein ASPCADRAFT_204536 [Aspergillus carbonarius ITEM 5010]|uniref:Uncharacterized protein n=1 Tax=Aspergillus carbonarius (strain ITEM 5010) TaxID=602072 RepID=A0A1R3RWJ2_ASPC5|nr:hypothetical protein ASPCADRAFT_204536 [Aspergillus carbonarius ITEM 5010]